MKRETYAGDSLKILQFIPALINKTFPIPARFRSALPSNIAELSRLLTNNRGKRALSYMGRPNYLSAYLHYFLPWNIYRLCLLLPTLQLNFSSGDVITDIGCGPLTFTAALWISRPEFRNIPLEFNCVDRSNPALDAGKKFFNALCSTVKEDCQWKINFIHDDIDIRKKNITSKRKSANFVCAINMFNEVYEHLPHNNIEGLKHMANDCAKFLHNEASKDASILTVEPGVPQSGKFISFLRTSFMELERLPSAPCTHTSVCPLLPKKGGKQRWCHFAFDAAGAPNELRRLSAAAGLPKERLVFSFLQTGAVSNSIKPDEEEKIRVISDAFLIPRSQFGRYGCFSKGIVLLTGEKTRIDKLTSFSCINASSFNNTGVYDKKSGAVILELL